MAQEGVTPHPSILAARRRTSPIWSKPWAGIPVPLVLLAREVARRGVRATTATVRELMTALHERYPDHRELSLYASVEPSLRRLAPEVRAQLQPWPSFRAGSTSTWM